jgi:hypothetical protein
LELVSYLEVFQCLWTRGETRLDVKLDLDEAAEFERQFLKAFLHLPPPLERESFIRIVE